MNAIKAFAFLLSVILWGSSVYGGGSTDTTIYRFRPGKEVVFVYMGSTWCGPCQDPEFKEALKEVRTRIATEVRDSGANFWTLGIAVDEKIEAGYRFLKSVEPFDEISIGRGWQNSAAAKYAWIDEFGGSIVPQVLLVEREVSGMCIKSDIVNERVLLRFLNGKTDLLKWISENKSLSTVKTVRGIMIEQPRK